MQRGSLPLASLPRIDKALLHKALRIHVLNPVC